MYPALGWFWTLLNTGTYTKQSKRHLQVLTIGSMCLCIFVSILVLSAACCWEDTGVRNLGCTESQALFGKFRLLRSSVVTNAYKADGWFGFRLSMHLFLFKFQTITLGKKSQAAFMLDWGQALRTSLWLSMPGSSDHFGFVPFPLSICQLASTGNVSEARFRDHRITPLLATLNESLSLLVGPWEWKHDWGENFSPSKR